MDGRGKGRIGLKLVCSDGFSEWESRKERLEQGMDNRGKGRVGLKLVCSDGFSEWESRIEQP
jgi:hypothetical protein